MENYFASRPNSGSYTNLKTRLFKKVKANGINDQIFVIVQNAIEEVLAQEKVILSRSERMRLFSQVLKLVLEDMIKKLDDRSRSA